MIRSAVIGCGGISAEHLRFLSQRRDVTLAAVCDLSSIAARYTAELFGAQAHFTDHRAMLAAVTPDVVHVLTPPTTHKRLALDVLAGGAHVICEKPLALTPQDVAEVLDAAQRAGRFAVESQNFRFNDPVIDIERRLSKGEIGRVVSVEMLYALDITCGPLAAEFGNPTAGLPGGAIFDFLPHLAYMSLHFLGYPPIVRSAAHWSNRSGVRGVGHDELRAVVDFGSCDALIRYSSHSRPPAVSLVVRGERGTIETELFNPFCRVEVKRGPALVSPLAGTALNGARLAWSGPRNFAQKVMGHGPYHGMDRMLDRVYTALAAGDAPPITADQIMRTAELIAALVADVEEHGTR